MNANHIVNMLNAGTRHDVQGKWQFCNNRDPFSQTEARTYTDYEETVNQKLELASIRKEPICDINHEYYVDFTKGPVGADGMQFNKKDLTRQRPVKRQTI